MSNFFSDLMFSSRKRNRDLSDAIFRKSLVMLKWTGVIWCVGMTTTRKEYYEDGVMIKFEEVPTIFEGVKTDLLIYDDFDEKILNASNPEFIKEYLGEFTDEKK